MLISIIIPTLNEVQRLPRCIGRIREVAVSEGPVEIVVVDGGRCDGSGKYAHLSDRFTSSPKGKSIQCNAGASIASGTVLLFLHATISLPVGALTAIRENIDGGFVGGGFNNRFVGLDDKTLRLRKLLTLGAPNPDHEKNLRFYGDNGIFVRKDVFEELNGFKEIEIMEDYDFSKRLRANYPVRRILEPRLVVSPRRQIRSGLLKTRLQWITIHTLYNLGVPPRALKRLYSDTR